jgi:four helix bundle protein
VGVELLVALRAAKIQDTKLRDECLRAAKGVCCNIAEGAGRVTRADKARAFTVARGEVIEAFAALEVAAHCGEALEADVARCRDLTERVYSMLTALIR